MRALEELLRFLPRSSAQFHDCFNFRRSDDGGYSYVFKQPTTPEEEALCKEAMEGCPVEAIGNDGEG